MQHTATSVMLACLMTLAAPAWAQQASCESLDNLIKVKQGGPAKPAAAVQGPGDVKLAILDPKHVEMLDGIQNQLVKVTRRKALLVVCANDTVNAIAAVMRGVPVVMIDVALMELLRFDKDSIAFVLAHEYAHLILGHRSAPVGAADAQEAAKAGEEHERQTGRRGSGVIAALAHIDAKRATFSRQQERQADEAGYEFMVAAGFKPGGALDASKILLVTMGNNPSGYFDSHPGWEDRVAMLQGAVKRDEQRKEAQETAERRRRAEASRIGAAQDLLERRQWPELGSYVRNWLAVLPDSGPGWYYSGVYERQVRRNPRAAQLAFEKSLSYDPDNEDALYGLCLTLGDLKYRAESAFCARDLRGTDKYDALVKERFDNRLFSNKRSAFLPPALWVGRERDGSTVITNSEAVLESRGLPKLSLPPEREPLPWRR
jgi:predicted Zn-dependent protease